MTNIKQLWATPVWYKNFGEDNLNRTIFNTIISTLDMNYYTYVNGNKPVSNIFDLKYDNIEQLLRTIIEPSLKEFISELMEEVQEEFTIDIFGWSHVQEYGDSILCHNHENSHISGIYYVNVPKGAETRGGINLYDPRFNANMLSWMSNSYKKERLYIKPKNGDLLLFPSYVWHDTEPNLSGIPRVTIPFDTCVTVKDLKR